MFVISGNSWHLSVQRSAVGNLFSWYWTIVTLPSTCGKNINSMNNVMSLIRKRPKWTMVVKCVTIYLVPGSKTVDQFNFWCWRFPVSTNKNRVVRKYLTSCSKFWPLNQKLTDQSEDIVHTFPFVDKNRRMVRERTRNVKITTRLTFYQINTLLARKFRRLIFGHFFLILDKLRTKISDTSLKHC